MQGLREVYREFRSIIWVLWAVAGVRLAMDAIAEDDKTAFMMSVYAGSAVLFLYNGVTGAMDHIGWKRLLGGCLMLSVLCWSIPNGIAYTVAQFNGWTHGRFYSDPEESALIDRHQADGMSFFEALEQVEKDLGRTVQTRCDEPQETTGGKLGVGLKMAAFTGIGGALWNLVFGSLLLGVPMSLRRRRS